MKITLGNNYIELIPIYEVGRTGPIEYIRRRSSFLREFMNSKDIVKYKIIAEEYKILDFDEWIETTTQCKFGFIGN